MGAPFELRSCVAFDINLEAARERKLQFSLLAGCQGPKYASSTPESQTFANLQGVNVLYAHVNAYQLPTCTRILDYVCVIHDVN